ncbi:ATP-dependent DNA helicase RecQ [Bifidobacterium saguini DSM 23967]|uniref:ATP-dependent DNA helicase RecQ n=1 Tax=Bifidobacterium saguini DSM 23967 TaxID=1437607 RepID=A0A087DCH6_9BIFI|nr:ATP-dependent DNA helicase RecQ [Bifidobacterium saguini]KFI93226.1 ATP-dependent DNA helicase RecQ [Bifidobacterium saguini DSM 23967]
MDGDSFSLAALRRIFGYDSFRPGQREAVEAAITGRDVMAVMPTGGGKSICYQLPAARPGTFTLVITPLRALMRDQVQHLEAKGIPAALIDSGLTETQRADVYDRARHGGLRILYVSPERLDTADFREFIHSMTIDLLAVDEAHCVLHWGSDFRPAYLRIGPFIESLPQRPTIMALTATASRIQADEICGLLHLADPLRITTDADRPNITLGVTKARPRERRRLIADWAAKHAGSGIIYKESRKGVEQLAESLRDKGIDAQAFHAELRDEDKRRIQDGFLHGSPRVICATSAFGMGVDKPDVRWVLNDGPCKSLEAYWQEAGRAGRDGKPADAILYWSEGDWQWLRKITSEAMDRAEESGDPQRIEAARHTATRLEDMSEYCETGRCLKRVILSMFDPEGTKRSDCGRCSNCQGHHETGMARRGNPARRRRETADTDWTRERRQAARERFEADQRRRRDMAAKHATISEAEANASTQAVGTACAYLIGIEQELGRGIVADLLAAGLAGRENQRVLRTGIDLIPGFGSLKDMDDTEIISLIGRMEAIQAITRERFNELTPGPLADMYARKTKEKQR